MTYEFVTTLNRIRSFHPCEDGWRKLLAAHGGTSADMDTPINILEITESNGIQDAMWALRSVSHPELERVARLLAADFAEELLHIFETAYPEDKRPRLAIDAARKFANGEINAAARDAAWAAARDAASGRRLGRSNKNRKKIPQPYRGGAMIIEGWISKTNINVEPGTYKLIRVTGDAILHKPSGETWLVAFVRHGRLTACGWPESQVLLTDCELKRKATPGAKFSLLLEMERMSRPDSRQIHASIFLENWAKREAV